MVVVCETIINRNMNSEVIKATKSVQKELSDKHFQCDKCKKLFKCKVFQEEHILVVHGKEKSCMCDICQKSFCNAQNLRHHVEAVHGNIERNTCNLCAKSFGQNQNLRRHVKAVHEKVNDYKINTPLF